MVNAWFIGYKGSGEICISKITFNSNLNWQCWYLLILFTVVLNIYFVHEKNKVCSSSGEIRSISTVTDVSKIILLFYVCIAWNLTSLTIFQTPFGYIRGIHVNLIHFYSFLIIFLLCELDISNLTFRKKVLLLRK